jgi:SpoVK/Ycf46/Vps4 family AAA+-type ATPase
MAKKKKKSRASLEADSPATTPSNKTPTPIVTESQPAVVDLLSLRLVKSSTPPVKSLKYAPLILLNEADADQLDVLTGDQVLLLLTTTTETTSSSKTLEIQQTAIARAQIANTSAGYSSPVKYSLAPKTQRSKLTPGSCHIFPVSLANSLVGAEHSAAAPPNEPTTPVVQTPPPRATPSSSSKSKFSFAKGRGGDALISTPTKAAATTTPASPRTPSSLATTRNLWIVPLESSLGDRIAPFICRTATRIQITTASSNSNSNFNSKLDDQSSLGQRLVLAHTVGSYVSNHTRFPLSFQGQAADCQVCQIETKETTPLVRTTQKSENDVVTEALAKLSLVETAEGGDLLLEALKSMDEKEMATTVTLYKITNETLVRFGDDDEDKDNSNNKDTTKDTESSPRKTLVAGMESTVEQVQTLLSTPLLHPELFQAGGLRPPKGVLLHGPSGTGKSCLALQVAHNLQQQSSETNNGVHVEHVHCTSLQSQTALVGQAERRLVQVFQSAKRPRPGKSASLVILDDVHLICPRRQGTNLGADRLSATLLALLDGLDSSSGESSSSESSTPYPMVILAITTNPSLLDPALRRPGRLDSEVEVPLPDEPSTRSQILQFQLESLGAKASLSQTEWLALARLAKGFTGADLKLAVKEALRATVLHKERQATMGGTIITVNKENLEKAIRSTKPSAIKAVTVEIPQVHWSSIGGMDSVKHQLREAIELPLTHGHMFQKLGIRPPRGVLLYGPPGCSKTLMARALATEGHMNFLAVKGPELLSKWLGESERALASLFRRARLASPSVIFFDEVDAIASKRGGSNSGGERLLSQLLTELDGIQSKNDAAKKQRVVVVCATNRPDLLDSALMRPGRIDRMIYVGVPDEESRFGILQISLQGKACADDIDVSVTLCMEQEMGYRTNIFLRLLTWLMERSAVACLVQS